MLVFDKNNGTSLDIGNADIPEGYTDIPVPLEIQGQNVQFSGDRKSVV